MEAREVVARYLAALKETSGGEGQDLLAAFRLTRKVAQNLGDFWDQASSQGGPAALDFLGLAHLPGQSWENLAPSLSAALGGSGGGLEEAVTRASLSETMRRRLPPDGQLIFTSGKSFVSVPPPAQVVQEFLATALYMRLGLDLGESLEAAASSYSHLKSGLRNLKESIEKAKGRGPGEPPATGQWSGLAGWTWVTGTLEALISTFWVSHEPVAHP
jgi:hypothetical protein